jgi:hypothetical protein
VGPEEENAVEDGRGGRDYGAGYGGCAPFVGARGEEVVCDCEEAEGGGCEGGAGVFVSMCLLYYVYSTYRKMASAWKISSRQAKHNSAVKE